MTIEFHTTVSKRGIVKIPSRYKLEDSKVKITVEPIQEILDDKFNFEAFVAKWGGFFSTDLDYDQAKYNYLTEKYK